MKGRASLMSSASDHWFTPNPVLDLIERFDPIVLDPCSHPESPAFKRAEITCSLTPVAGDDGRQLDLAGCRDGLLLDWLTIAERGLVFVNWPYSDPDPWSQRCREHGARGGELIALCPARTDTKWWHACAPYASCVAFWKGRMKFERPGGQKAAGAPFPSALLYFGERRRRFYATFQGAAWLVDTV
jgi:hypothetical protein